MGDFNQRVEAQLWAAYANRVWDIVEVLSKEACYGCSHKKINETDHNVCRLGKNERTKRFLRKAAEKVIRAQIVEDWRNLINEFSPPLEESELLLFDESWINAQLRRNDRYATLLRILCDDDDVECARFTEGDTIPLEVSDVSDEGGEYLQPRNQSERKLAQCSSHESDEELMVTTTFMEDVVQPIPYDEKMFPDSLEQSTALADDISMASTKQSQTNAEIIAEILDEGIAPQEDEWDQHWSERDVSNAYEIIQTSQRRVAKFNTAATDYLLKVKDLSVRGLREVLHFLEAVFLSILATITTGMLPTDQVRFVMHSPQLSYPISLPFMTLTDLTPKRIMFEIERVLQSNEQFSLDGNVHVHLIHVGMPSGGKGKIGRGGVNLQKRLQNKKCFVQILNKDELCLARAIVTAISREKKDRWSSFRKGASIQRSEALKLHSRAGVPVKRCGLEKVKKFQEVLPEYQLVIVSAECFDQIVYKGPDADKVIFLYFHNGHFNIITSMKAFLDRAYFCLKCCKGYDVEDGRHHRCDKCCCCQKSGCPDVDQWQQCDDCTRFFKGPTCFSNHKNRKGKAKSVCETYTECPECGKVIDRTQRDPADHKCGEMQCSICKTFVDPLSHRCYMQPLKRKNYTETDEEVPKKKRKVTKEGATKNNKPKYLFFDFECMQETGTHVPNLVVVQDETGQEKVFSGPNTRDEFCDWLFSGDHRGAICIAHNLKGYDSYFILQYLYENAIRPNLIMDGAKVMMIEVPRGKIKFIDSLNFLAMPLSDLPKAFGLTELSKGVFPHLFNTQANQTYEGEIPDVNFYDPSGMKREERDKFLLWHQEQKDKKVVFNMQYEMKKYCRSDVNILRQCCLKFRSLIMELCDVDPFEQCITIPSVCSTIFRQTFLEKDTIAIIPPEGYRPKVKQSILAYKWLAYESHKRGIRIQHGHNGGEKRVGRYSLDGYHAESNTAFELDGCFHHGHSLCYPGHEINPLNGLRMSELHERTLERRRYLEEMGIKVVHIWECEFKKQLKENTEIAAYVKELSFEQEPMNPRDAFLGGRVNATRLLVNAQQAEKIKYVDFTSLYPYINKYGTYPIGHPTIITQDFDDIQNYFGLINCVILPPRGLYHPVLPFKGNGKLLFCLCRTCALTSQQTRCCHTDEERALHGTWVSLEIELALKMGYRVLKMHEIWHFEKKTKELFKGYVNTFLKRKQEASGWPQWCQTDHDKRRYREKYKEKEGIDLHQQAIVRNEAERSVWKKMLNNLWGKFGQRPNRPKVEVINNSAEYFDLLTSSKAEVTNAHLINEEVIEVHYVLKEGFVEASDQTNVVLAAFTTAQARIKLYDLLDKLERRVCYYDTDSVIFSVKEGEWEPPLGDYLGELTNELDDGDHIVTFVSAGPKNYAYKTESGKTCCKVRGFTLNFRTSEKINLESMVELVTRKTEKSESSIDVITPHKIVRDQQRKTILSQTQVKTYRLVYDKRVIQDDFDTLPYGY